MADKVTVVTDALREESKKWIPQSEKLESARNAAAQLTLGPLAFFAGPRVDFNAEYRAYAEFHDKLVTLLGEGAMECEQMSIVLKRIADNYDETDEQAAQDFESIYSV